MDAMSFKAFAVANEIDLNKIANDCGIPKKYTWEEPLILQDDILKSILGKEVAGLQKVLVFSFGSVVFINHQRQEEITTFLNYIHSFESDIEVRHPERYSDDYSLHIGETPGIEMTDEYVMAPQFEIFYPELISVVIAKSVALEKTEEQLGRILDKLETMIDRLEKGKLRISDKELARTTARIVRHEYNTIAYIMILDKPDITWTNSNAGELYDRMSDFFELNDRYAILKNKTEILYNMMEGFSTISHSIRGLFVEWVIVALIVAEVILMLVEIFR
ncbi:MAG: hypothetical protein K0R57_3415 [Paenibacillaceae bacterium]|jgi:uncharacterized Rmd1/YagE family protein|nr:hypothetical protein [Paenibacillaceae bacterium]